MTFPTVQGTPSSGNNTTAVTNHTVNLPASIQAGETLIAFFGHKDSANGATFPAGWTKFAEAANSAGSGAVLAVAWRKADGSEGASITVTTVTSSRDAYAVYRIGSAEDPTVTPPEAQTATGTNTVNPNPPSLTPTGGAKDYLWLAAFASSHGRITSSLPTNYTDSVGSGSDAGTATHVGVGSGRRELNAASEDPGTFTTTGTAVEEVAVLTVATHPTSGGGAAGHPAMRRLTLFEHINGLYRPKNLKVF